MPWFGNQPYTGFRAVNLSGSTAIRIQAGAAAGTIRAELSENLSRAWTMPNKSGTFPISGTFLAQIPAIAANAFSRTAITVSGIRVEDGLVVTEQGDPLLNIGSIIHPAMLIAAKAGNGSITLTFSSPSGTTSAYQEIVMAYTAVR